MIEKTRAIGNSEMAVTLTPERCSYLASVIVHDLGLIERFPNLPREAKPFFSAVSPSALTLSGVEFMPLMEKLAEIERDSITYFACLGAFLKARLKYDLILQNQPIPTMDQVGPRGLLQFGSMNPKALAGLLLWRKWMYDIDNRAAQETGYLFEPIIAHALGGSPAAARKSPIKRNNNPKEGRQVDCIRDQRAYEFKLRVTIAASGQGRWGQELQFPIDCRKSGYTPVLIVFDPTKNTKLTELERAFKAQNGEVYIGDDAWAHLEKEAGKTMSMFINKYVRTPIEALIKESPGEVLPDVTLSMKNSTLSITVGPETVSIQRGASIPELTDDNILPDDVDDSIPGI
jgi:hypothetical protein